MPEKQKTRIKPKNTPVKKGRVSYRDQKSGHIIGSNNAKKISDKVISNDHMLNELQADYLYDARYFNTDNVAKTFSLLGITGSATKNLSSEFDYIELGNAGITKNAINTLAENIGVSRKFISENIFDVSVKTLERKTNRTKLDKKISSHAIEIAKVVQHAWQVFRDEDKVKRWLNRANRALNNKKPVELFDTLSGLLMVNDILGRIEEGVYS